MSDDRGATVVGNVDMDEIRPSTRVLRHTYDVRNDAIDAGHAAHACVTRCKKQTRSTQRRNAAAVRGVEESSIE